MSLESVLNKFCKGEVDLDADETGTARNSRNWLVEKILGFPANDTSFPLIHPDERVFFGSFARKTKVRPLDDIDLMVIMNAQGGSYHQGIDTIRVTSGANSRFQAFETDGHVSSRKVINKFIQGLKTISQYAQADINRRQEAATLNLKSYDWVFDVVPCFITSEESNGRDYFLIPDGNGHWKKTDPRIDRKRVKDINQHHGGAVLPMVRLVKYWKDRLSIESGGSYLIECMVVNWYETAKEETTRFKFIDFYYVLESIANQVLWNVADPKDIVSNINGLTWEQRRVLSDKAKSDAKTLYEGFSMLPDHEAALDKYQTVLGPNFGGYR